MRLHCQSVVSVDSNQHRLDNNFTLARQIWTDHERRIKQCQDSLKVIDLFSRNLSQNVQNKFDGLESNIQKSTEQKIKSNIGFYLSSQIESFFKAKQKDKPNEAEISKMIENRLNTSAASIKSQLIEQTQSIIKAEMVQLRKKEKKTRDRSWLDTKVANKEAELGVEQQWVEEKLSQITIQNKRLYEKLQRLEGQIARSSSTTSFEINRIDQQLSEYRSHVISISDDWKSQKYKFKLDSVSTNSSKSVVDEKYIEKYFAEVNQHLANILTKTQFESLHANVIWKSINQTRQELDEMKIQLKSYEQQRSMLGLITEGIDKYEQFISESFQQIKKTHQKTAVQFKAQLTQQGEMLGKLQSENTKLSKDLLSQSNAYEQFVTKMQEKWTNLEYRLSANTQSLEAIVKMYEQAKQETTRKNAEALRLSKETDRKFGDLVDQMRHSFSKLKEEVSAEVATHANRTEVKELWKGIGILENKLSIYKAEADQVFRLNKSSWMVQDKEVSRTTQDKFSNTLMGNNTSRSKIKSEDFFQKTAKQKLKGKPEG